MAEQPDHQQNEVDVDTENDVAEADGALPIPESADALLEIATKEDDAATEDFDIHQWGIRVKIRSTSLRSFWETAHKIGLAQQAKKQDIELVQQRAWLEACIVEPKFTRDQVSKLVDRSSKPLLDLVQRCRIISGDLPDDYEDLVKLLGEGIGQAGERAEPMPPALSD